MPVCVHCSAPTDALFVSYGPTHLVCTRCERCEAFADPYVEYEPIIVVIDLILVKPRAYRHVLFNRNQSLQSVSDKEKSTTHHYQRSERRRGWFVLVRHCVAMLMVDAYLRWFHLCAGQRQGKGGLLGHRSGLLTSFLRILASTSVLMLALHISVNVASITYHRILRMATKRKFIKVEEHELDRFASRQISSALLLSNVTPVFLLVLLLLWQQPSDANVSRSNSSWRWDEASIDWVIRSLVSGLSAGVALGVVLPLQRTKLGALTATSILVLGWYVQFVASQWLHLPFHSGVGVLQTDAGRASAELYCRPR